jgi:hypothetical protein
MFLTEQMIRLVFQGRRSYSLSYFLEAVRRRLAGQMHAGMCEHLGGRADEILTLVTGLVAGDLEEWASRYQFRVHKVSAITGHYLVLQP